MEHRTFGKTGLHVSLLGFGGSEIGYQGATAETVTKLLNAAIDAGLNVLDTAECYKNSEELIGAAVSHRRDDFHLFTKVGHEHGWGAGDDWSAQSIERTIERSLQRLRTDHVDLVQLHSCKASVIAQGEAIKALERAKAAGKTRFIGYSGDSDDAIAAIKTNAFDTLQTSVSIADQESIERVLPLAVERNMGVIAKRPIANAAWRDTKRPSGAYSETYWDRLTHLRYDFLNGWPERSLDETAAAKVSEIALRFTMTVPGVHTMIVGTTKPDRWAKNAAMIAKEELPKAEYDAIRAKWKQVARSDWVGQV
ncbi:MAG TPA: aldo/keto reductase [Phycisphaerales bacterium]|nr:aldo/keto reductase [Phycisphaerales bacterium]